MRSSSNLLRSTAFHSAGLMLTAMFLMPIIWAILASFKPPMESGLSSLTPWPSGSWSVENYTAIGKYGEGFGAYLNNSLVVSLLTVTWTVVISTLCGYGFAKFDFPLKKTAFLLLLSTIAIPFQSIVTPLFVIFSKAGLQNSLFGLSLIYLSLQVAFSTFIMRNAFEAVPREISEAAHVDGASAFRIFLMHLPLAVPGIVSVALFSFVGAWNEFFAALIFISDQASFTLPILMRSLTRGAYGEVNWGGLQASVTLTILPCLLVFIALQKYYVNGLMAGSVK